MARRKKIAVIVINRTNYGRLKSIMQAIKINPHLELQTIVGSSMLLQRFGEPVKLIRKDKFNIDAASYTIIEGETPLTMAKSTAIGLSEFATIFNNLRPDIILINADRFELLGATIAASYLNIPIAHTLGGEITGTIDESVRHAITKLAHIHFPATEKAKKRIIQMGENPKYVFKVGNAAIDIIKKTKLILKNKEFWKRKSKGVGAAINVEEPFILVLQHPVTTEYGCGFEQMNETLKAVSEIKMPTIMFWPNVDAGGQDISKAIRVFRELKNSSRLHLFKNISVEDYIRLIANASCIVGNSSSAFIEGSFLGTPAVNIGTRQHGREQTPNVINVGYNNQEIKSAILRQIKHGWYPKSKIFGDGNTGKKIAEILSKIEVGIQKKFHF